MIITIAGKPGSGKSTVGRMIAKKLGYKFYSTGDLRGKIAMDLGMTIDELNEIGVKEDWTDKLIDAKTEKIGKEKDNFVIDSWMAWHFIPKSVKIYLDVDPRIGAERIFREQRPDEEKKETVEEVMETIQKRLKDSAARYKKYYGVDILDLTNFDLVIDTSAITAEEVTEKILRFIKKFQIKP
ncbi:cytidylate kinase [Candidatus Woesearchaeota archaeon]|nr:MAG: cytidylate kinase [Candidatus Woesearchaeota archaeon]